jgi:hypothetical protein
MAIVFMDGFDIGDVATKWNVVTGSTSPSLTTRFGTGRSIVFGGGSNYVMKYFTASAEVYVGFAAYTMVSAGVTLVNLFTDSGVSVQLSLVTNSNGSIALRRGGTQVAITAAGVISSGWNYIEMRAKVDPSTGIFELKVNGVVSATFSGNTKNTGTSNSIDAIQLTNGASINWYVDDFYICDATGSAPYNTYLGEMRVYSLSPTGAGSFTQWTPDTGSNYARVNEVPYSAANYVQSATTGQRDTYVMADLPGSVGIIMAVQNNMIAKRTDASAISVKPAIKSGASVYYGASAALTPNDTTVSDIRTTDPNTSAAWTAGGVNALEGGFEVA